MIKINRALFECDGPAWVLAGEFATIGESVVDSVLTVDAFLNKEEAFNMLLSGAYAQIVGDSVVGAKDIPMETKAKLIIDFLTDKNGTDGVPIPRKGIDY